MITSSPPSSWWWRGGPPPASESRRLCIWPWQRSSPWSSSCRRCRPSSSGAWRSCRGTQPDPVHYPCRIVDVSALMELWSWLWFRWRPAACTVFRTIARGSSGLASHSVVRRSKTLYYISISLAIIEMAAHDNGVDPRVLDYLQVRTNSPTGGGVKGLRWGRIWHQLRGLCTLGEIIMLRSLLAEMLRFLFIRIWLHAWNIEETVWGSRRF